MRRYDFAAVAAHALRRLSARLEPASDKNMPVMAVGAMIAGMLLSVSLLAATESKTPETPEAPSAAAIVLPVALQMDEKLEERRKSPPRGYSSSDEPTERAVAGAQDSEIRWFNNRPIRPVKTMQMLVTAYSPDAQSCGEWADGFTASGYSVWTNGMKLVAADTSVLPFGSLVSVPGYDSGHVVPVLDRGGAIKGHRLDVLYPTHERALQWGVQRLEVTIWEYADGEPNGFRQQHHRR